MPRPTKKSKPYIVVFCEGESEQVYTDFLRKEFKDVASIKRPSSTGLFEEADSKSSKRERNSTRFSLIVPDSLPRRSKMIPSATTS